MNKKVFAIIFLITSFFGVDVEAAYRDVIQSEGTLLNYWPMDEISGTTTLSAAVGGIPINLSGATAGASGQVDGTAISFNGTSNSAETASSLNLTAYNKVVVEALVYIPSYTSTGRTVWEFSPNVTNSPPDTFMYNVDGGVNGAEALSNVALQGDRGYSISTFTRPTAGSWHHIVTVYDKGLSSNEVNLYIDGVLQTATRPFNSNNTNNFGNRVLYLMARSASVSHTQGKMQHLAIYSDLSEARILAHANLINAASATTVTLSGPTTGSNGIAGSNYTVGTDGLVAGEVIVTPSDGGGGGTFTPTTVTISAGTPTATFTYTPGSVGSKTISVTNDGGLNNPSSIVIIVSAPAYQSTIQAEGTLLNYWPMTESSGTTISSLVGGVNINLTGATAGVAGKVGGTAVSFNGTNNSGQTASTINLTAYNKLAVEALVYFNSYNDVYKQAWELGPDAINTGFGYVYDGGTGSGTTSNVFLNGDVGYNLALYVRPSVATWHHVVTVYDKGLSSNEVSFYVDGVLQTVSSQPFNLDNTNNFGNQIFYLMSRGGSSYYGNGKMQHLAIYSDLSDARILTHANLLNTASAVTLTGPTTGINGSASSNFSVSSDLPITSSIVVTPNDSSAGGTFTPTTVTISAGTPTATFTYTPGSVGSKSISVTNNGGLSNPDTISYTVTSNTPASSVLITGPSSGSVNSASTNFTISANGIISGNLIITPNDNDDGGTFTPTSVTISSATSTATFTYTALSPGVKNISITNNQSLSNPSSVNYSAAMVGSGLVLGDSTVATYAGGTQIADFIYTTAQANAGWGVTNIAVPGHTIAQQKTVYLSTGNRSTVDYTIAQIGLNDLNPAESSSVAIARLQDLINTINLNKKTGALTIASTMIPCKQRLIDIYGSVNGLISQQKWIDINEAIKGNGPTPITGVDYRISNHTPLLADSGGNLATVYDTGDHIHENNAARQIIARVWRDSLAELNLLSPATSSVPSIVSVTVGNNGFATIVFNPPQFNGGSQVTGYTIISNPSGVDTDLGSTSTSRVVNGLIDGINYNFTVKAVNSVGWSDNSVVSSNITAIDEISPSISNIISTPGKTTSNVTWTTDQLSKSYIEYGLSSENTNLSASDLALKTSHNINLTGLNTNKTYYYRIISEDISGNISTSSNQTFVTLPDDLIVTIPVSYLSPGSSSSGPDSIPLSLRPQVTNTITTTPTSYTFTKSLSSGQSNTEVKSLQKYLNSKGFTVSKLGGGSLGKETNYFGPATKAALIKFQKANNIYPAIGFFGPITRAFIANNK